MKYKITYQENGKCKYITLDTLENLPNNILKIEKIFHFKQIKLKQNNQSDIFEMFKQLQIMLNANLTLNESIELLLTNRQNDTIMEILHSIKNSITNGIPIDKALEKYKSDIGNISLLFLKLGIENGNLKQSLSSLVQILQENKETKLQLNNTTRYPKLLILSLFISMGMVFTYVVPNFEHIFKSIGGEIPFSTSVLLFFNSLVTNYYYIVFSIVVGVFVSFYFLYKKFNLFFDKMIILNIPIISRVLKDYYFYRLFLLISVIVKSKYQFQIAIENSKLLIPNLYIKNSIEDIIQNIKSGVSISNAFEKTKLFDDLTIRLLLTAEQTTQYENVLQDITLYYKQRFQMSLKLFSSFIEPVIIMIISLIVMWLIMAIMLPIWNMSSILS